MVVCTLSDVAKIYNFRRPGLFFQTPKRPSQLCIILLFLPPNYIHTTSPFQSPTSYNGPPSDKKAYPYTCRRQAQSSHGRTTPQCCSQGQNSKVHGHPHRRRRSRAQYLPACPRHKKDDGAAYSYSFESMFAHPREKFILILILLGTKIQQTPRLHHHGRSPRCYPVAPLLP